MIKSSAFINFQHILLYIIIILDYNGLGVFPGNSFFQYLTISVVSFALLYLYKHEIFSKSNPLKLPIIALFLLIAGSIIINLIQIAIYKSYDLALLFLNFRGFHRYLLLLLIIALIDSPQELYSFTRGVVILGISAGLIVLIFVIFNISNSSIYILSEGTRGFDKYRVMVPTDILLALSFFYLLSVFIFYSRNISILMFIVIVCFGILIQLHRGVILTFLFSIIGYFILVTYTRKITIKFSSIIYLSLTISLIMLIIANFSNMDLKYINYIYDTTTNEYQDNTGTFISRYNLILNGFQYIFDNFLLLGVGFIWEITDVEIYLKNSFVVSSIGDNSYYNIIMLFGFLGIIIYFSIIYKIFTQTINVVRNTSNKFPVLLSFTLFSANIYWVFRAFTGDYISSNASTTGTLIIWGLTYKLLEFNQPFITSKHPINY